MKKYLASENISTVFPSFDDLHLTRQSSEGTGADLPFFLLPEISSLIQTGRQTTGLLQPPLDLAFDRFVKRLFDIVFASLVILLILSWLVPLLAIIIRCNSKGPVFFLQKRNKRNGAIFTCIKFRSMFVNPSADILPAVDNDQRITRVGRFLRNHFIDELPQFFNVLLGDMSVIGPRPHMISENLKYECLLDHYSFRHNVKPGISGLAQVTGFAGITKGIQGMQGRLNMDLFYARHWTFRMDLFILYKSCLKILS